jgi:hypothetical protein
MGPKFMQQNIHISLKSRPDIANGLKNPATKHPHFASGKGGRDVTKHFEEIGHHVTCDKLSTLKPGWMKNTWTDCISVRMSQ